MKKYEHNKEIRGIGFPLKVASILFHRHMVGQSTEMLQADVCRELGISLPNLYRKFKYNNQEVKDFMQMTGLYRYKVHGRVYFNLDVRQYKLFLMGLYD